MKLFPFIALILIFTSTSSFAKVLPANCISINGTVGIDMTNFMLNDLKVKKEDVILEKTKSELLYSNSVGIPLSTYYGEQEKKSEGVNSEDTTTISEYAHTFREDNAKNIIIKFTYENVENKHNVFLASALVNDHDCAVRFNGYLVVKREF
ncbi:hypothetical protein [Xenorhabdus bharatensis]|uniref:hypothetical protein n=1 Tax=Xenorhabdus bharatensis TaxID=3136256 RepID=UPI0030F3714F